MKKYNPSLFPFERKYIHLNSHKIHYVDEGQGDIILFSHPPLASSFMYRNFIKVLRKRFRCIAIDYPLFGLSTTSKNYEATIAAQSNVLTNFIQTLNLNDIFVLGHDVGGPSAFKTVLDLPERFKGLILTDTIIFPVKEYPKINKMLSLVGSTLFSLINRYTNVLIHLTYNFGIRTRRLSSQEKQAYKDMFKTHHQRKAITDLLYNLKEDNNLMQHIKHGFQTQLNQKPTLLIYGENDPVREMGIANRIHKMMTNSELHLIKGEGHFPHEGQAELMCELIDTWINKVNSKQCNFNPPSSMATKA